MLPRAKVQTLGPWYKGAFYNLPAELVPEDGIADMENIRIGTGGEAIKREGYDSYYDLATLGATTVVTMVAEFTTSSGSAFVVVVAGTAVYYYKSSTAEWSAITGTLSITAGADNVWEWCDCNGTLVACNGVDAPWKWSGTGNATALDLDSMFTAPKHCAYFEDRLWLGGESANADRVWRSNAGDIETWTATDFYNIGAPITGLSPFDDALTVHTKAAIYMIRSTSNSTIPFQLEQAIVGAGTLSGRCIINLSNRAQLFIMRDGIYRWTKGEEKVEKVSYQLDDGYWSYLNDARFLKSFALYYQARNEVWFMLPYGTSQSQMNQIQIYNEYDDPDEGESYRWYGPMTGGTAFYRDSGAIVAGKPHLGSHTGFLYDHVDSGLTDDGTAISASFKTGAPPPEEDNAAQVYRWLFVRTYYDPNYTYQFFSNQENEDGIGAAESVSVSGIGFTLDEDQLDVNSMGTVKMNFADHRLLGFGSHMGMRYTNSATTQTMRIRMALVHHRQLGLRRRRTVTVE